MFYTLSHCLKYVINQPNPLNQPETPSFVTEEVEDDWTLVETSQHTFNKDLDVDIDYPTPPPSPPVETTWLITPPPCFNPETRFPVEKLSPLENLLIEHPSIFFKSPTTNLEPVAKNTNSSQKAVAAEKENKVVPHQCKNEKLVRCSRRKRKMRQNPTGTVIILRKRQSNCQFKRRNWEVSKRSNTNTKKMHRIIQQPRKHC